MRLRYLAIDILAVIMPLGYNLPVLQERVAGL